MSRDTSNVSAQFRERVPRLAGELGIPGIDEVWARKAYRFRSALAHGANPASALEKGQGIEAIRDEFDAMVMLMEDLVRESLRRALLDPRWRALFDDLDKAWPIKAGSRFNQRAPAPEGHPAPGVNSGPTSEAPEVLGASPAEECRRAVGDDRFEQLRLQVRTLPEAIDRESVFRTIAGGVFKRRGWKILDPEWCRDRDGALEAVGRAIDRLKAAMRRSPWAAEAPETDLAEIHVGPLEREYRRLVEVEPVEGGGHAIPFTMLSRTRLGWVKPGAGGRPCETWHSEARAELQAIGLSGNEAEALVEIAGLAGPTPLRGPEA